MGGLLGQLFDIDCFFKNNHLMTTTLLLKLNASWHWSITFGYAFGLTFYLSLKNKNGAIDTVFERLLHKQPINGEDLKHRLGQCNARRLCLLGNQAIYGVD